MFQLGGSFHAGDWFGLPEAAIGWPGGKQTRRCLLLEDCSSAGLAQIFPRTTKSGGGLLHKSHPPGHEPGCLLDRDGHIRLVRLSVDSSRLPSAFSCADPDKNLVARLRSMRQRP